jgi:hypothetical protein
MRSNRFDEARYDDDNEDKSISEPFYNEEIRCREVALFLRNRVAGSIELFSAVDDNEPRWRLGVTIGGMQRGGP